LHKSTMAIHGNSHKKSVYGELSVPIFQTSSFFFPSAEAGAARFAGDDPGYIYSRLNNPTVNALEELVASLENGTEAMATATGMAAVTTVLVALLDRDAHVVATDSLYGPSRIAIETELARFGVQSTFVDSSDLDNIRKTIRPDTRQIYVETPTNPTMKITDLRGMRGFRGSG
jgi:methionine-gamma-lyase